MVSFGSNDSGVNSSRYCRYHIIVSLWDSDLTPSVESAGYSFNAWMVEHAMRMAIKTLQGDYLEVLPLKAKEFGCACAANLPPTRVKTCTPQERTVAIARYLTHRSNSCSSIIGLQSRLRRPSLREVSKLHQHDHLVDPIRPFKVLTQIANIDTLTPSSHAQTEGASFV